MAQEPPPQPIGDPLLARLEQLSRRGRQAPSSPNSPNAFPPPVPPLVAPPFKDEQTPRPPSSVSPTAGSKAPRRRHPARSARIGALVVSCAGAGGLTALFASLNANASTSDLAGIVASPVTSASTSTAAAAQSTPTTATSSSSTGAAATTAPASTTQVFQGEVVDTRYGPVEVQISISNGELADITVLAYPDDERKSVRINASALPILRSEVLSAQSSDVDTVSGATYTSEGYLLSLQSALDEARAAGLTTIV